MLVFLVLLGLGALAGAWLVWRRINATPPEPEPEATAAELRARLGLEPPPSTEPHAQAWPAPVEASEDDDADDPWAGFVLWDLPGPRVIEVSYGHESGGTTERTIELRTFMVPRNSTTGRPTHIRGFCRLRQATRAFRVDRIVEAFEGGRGEEIEDFAARLLARNAKPRTARWDL